MKQMIPSQFCLLKFCRLLVSAILYFQCTVHQDYYCEYLRLFVSCRRALWCILIGFYEKAEIIQSLPNTIVSESSFPVMWITKSLSVVVGITEAFSAENIILCKSMIFSLLDYTSHVLFSIGKYQSVCAISINKEAEMSCEEISNHMICHEENNLLSSSQSSPKLEALKCLTFMAENLKEHKHSLLVSINNSPHNVSVGSGLTTENIIRFSSAVCCFSRVLWGLTSSTGQRDAKDIEEKQILMWKSEHASELNSCISVFMELSDVFVNKFLFESNQLSKSSHNTQHSEDPAKANTSAGPENECKAAATCFTLSVDNVSKGVNDLGRALNPKGENSVARVLAGVDYSEAQGLNKHFLRSLVKGDHPEIALLLRQLLIAFSSLLRLNLQRNDRLLPSSLVSTFIEISQLLLLEFVEMVVVPQQSALLLLDGAHSYLRELVSYFPFTDPTSSRKVYTELIQIHMRAIGKTILLQGKGRTLTFHERQSSTKPLRCGSVEAYSSTELHCFALDEFRTRLRKSFRAYIERSSELHLLSTIQVIERSLVGILEGCTVIYDVKTSKDGEEILSVVAGGIDCFRMVLEFVSGK